MNHTEEYLPTKKRLTLVVIVLVAGSIIIWTLAAFQPEVKQKSREVKRLIEVEFLLVDNQKKATPILSQGTIS